MEMKQEDSTRIGNDDEARGKWESKDKNK